MIDEDYEYATTDLSAPEPTIIVIFGITGDLAKRYLLPSLYTLFKEGLIHPQTELVGVSRRPIDTEIVFDELRASVERAGKELDSAVIDQMRERAHGFQLDMDDPGGYDALYQELNRIEEGQGVCMNRLYYLSIPPSAYTNVIAHMGNSPLNGGCQHGKGQSRLLIEKPFGDDLASARKLIEITAQGFGEHQLFRIDHYLAKETAQNISTFRFENPLFETIWNSRHVASIDIVASEKIGVEGRGNFYEQQGALRDFIQNHLLQLLAVATMDQPERFDSDAVHAAKLQLLRSIRPIRADKVSQQTRRGQYEGYKQEVDNPDSHVETYAQIETYIDTPRWQDVPVRIRTGKAMASKFTTVTFTFTDRDAEEPDLPNSNQLQFRIQPNEGIALNLLAKKPGFDHELQPVVMDFGYEGSFGSQPDAYERVLLDAIRGDQTLFASSDEVLAAWQIVDEVVHAWQNNGDDLISYEYETDIDSLGV